MIALALAALLAGPFPYAEAPLGQARFGPPQPVKELPKAVEKIVSCPQLEGDGLPGFVPEASEDCLHLKIWAPEKASKAPVIVFFHGGGLRSGSGFREPYQGLRFAEAGAVFVTFNYRLGPFGWLSKEGEKHSRGLLDQAAALFWVKARIAEFGGDPENITLLGHSMGAWSIRQLVSAGLAPGGVRQVVLFSSGSFFGKAPNLALAAGKFKGAISLPWREVYEHFRGVRLSVNPSGPLNEEKWRGLRVLQTVLQDEYEGEPEAAARFRGRVCEAVELGRGLEGRADSWLYLLHGLGTRHGSELLALFSDSSAGERLRSLVLGFARDGSLPRSFWLLPALPYRAATPRALHLYPWLQLPRAIEACR